jgi:hypothetical protein
MFYIVIFSLLAVVLVVGGVTTMNRRRPSLATDEGLTNGGHKGGTTDSQVGHTPRSDASRQSEGKASAIQE